MSIDNLYDKDRPTGKTFWELLFEMIDDILYCTAAETARLMRVPEKEEST